MNAAQQFLEEVAANIRGLKADADVQALSRIWIREVTRYKYAYNFTWLGRPAIQFPQDLIALQEIIWRVRPQLVIETGVAHGGSLVFHASMLELLGADGLAIGVDIEIRSHNRAAIESHPLARRIRLIEGSSVDEAVIAQVRALAAGRKPVLVVLDSNHVHAHVLRELELYSPLVTKGSYLVVLDTLIEDMPPDLIKDRPWLPGNTPKTAVLEFLKLSRRFEVDTDIEAKLLLTTAPSGYLKCIGD